MLREFVSPLCFTGLIFFFSICGGIETSRAITPKAGNLSGYVCLITSVVVLPIFLWLSGIFKSEIASILTFDLCLLCCCVLVIIATIKAYDAKKYFVSSLVALYPSLFMLSLAYINSIEGTIGLVALLLVFVIASLTDTCAYFVGSVFKGKKLCPKLSPKKTWSGAVGGLLGGMIGALIVYYVFKGGLTEFAWWQFIVIGFIGAILDQVGDLFESFVKRFAGIKDMGKIMPGHGGVMDRLDGVMFVAFAVAVALIIMRV